ncbi:MAG TPA: hypothetical protein VNU96_01345 [Burkholderiales bacterium]|jgi:hypothetical protein|nr:hypothetical protein [Burkholderiales bacterium]
MQFLRLLIVLLSALAASAHAQLRTIPAEAKDGQMSPLQDMIVSVDGVAARFAPGMRIRDQDNRMVVPGAVAAGTQVKYLLDELGQVRQVWIPTPDEAKQGASKN